MSHYKEIKWMTRYNISSSSHLFTLCFMSFESHPKHINPLGIPFIISYFGSMWFPSKEWKKMQFMDPILVSTCLAHCHNRTILLYFLAGLAPVPMHLVTHTLHVEPCTRHVEQRVHQYHISCVFNSKKPFFFSSYHSHMIFHVMHNISSSCM